MAGALVAIGSAALAWLLLFRASDYGAEREFLVGGRDAGHGYHRGGRGNPGPGIGVHEASRSGDLGQILSRSGGEGGLMAGCSGVEESARALDAHFREILRWHFSPETGCPFWLNWAASRHWNPAEEITSFSQIDRFPNFEDAWLRDEPNESWISRAFTGRPYKVFETGGTTGLPKQRLSWEDHLIDYEEFSEHLDEEAFPRGANWLMLGPTGPRRLRISIEHLANSRGGSCYFVDF